MDEHEERQEGYVVPTYQGDDATTWYHFLHGNVPGHQIDFMYRPDVPQGVLTRQHFSHLSRLMKYIEPQTNSEYAFAIANLSRDDTQYEPGHGGLGMIFGFRIRGVTDHAGRQDPPFAHGIAAVDRRMDYATVLSSALSFYKHLFAKGEYDNPASVLYREYVRYSVENPGVVSYVLKAYTSDFEVLPQTDPSTLGLRWLTNEAPQPKRIVIVHPNSASFGAVAECAAKIAAVLYQSDIRWTSITTGRESDLPGGVTIRLVARRDAGAYESGGSLISIDDVPDDEAALAEKLFGAKPVGVPEATGPVGWRERYKSQSGSTSTPPPPMGEAVARAGAEVAGVDFEASSAPGSGDSAGGLWKARTGKDAGNGYVEPPKEWGQSARLTPEERRAAMGLPPLPKPASLPPPEAARPIEARPVEARAIEARPVEAQPRVPKAPVKASPVPVNAALAVATPAAPAVERAADRTSPPAPAVAMVNSAMTEAPQHAVDMPSGSQAGPATTERAGSKRWVWIGLVLACAVIAPVAYFAVVHGDSPGEAGLSGGTVGPGPSVTAPRSPVPSAEPSGMPTTQPTAGSTAQTPPPPEVRTGVQPGPAAPIETGEQAKQIISGTDKTITARPKRPPATTPTSEPTSVFKGTKL